MFVWFVSKFFAEIPKTKEQNQVIMDWAERLWKTKSMIWKWQTGESYWVSIEHTRGIKICSILEEVFSNIFLSQFTIYSLDVFFKFFLISCELTEKNIKKYLLKNLQTWYPGVFRLIF